MSIPSNISREHLLKAINKIEKEGIVKDADSQYYDLVYEGKRYPPKLVVSYANLFANGEELNRATFGGGIGQPSFKLLESHGFRIEKKENVEGTDENEGAFYQVLVDFINQAKEGILGTRDYIKEYQGLKVKVSFGQGNPARIPWIAFLNDVDTVSDGIYPVYLFYRDKNLLILSFGISETNKPKRSWGLSKKTIAEYFSERGYDLPERYGSSLIHAVYDTTKPLSKGEVETDLKSILTIYKKSSGQIDDVALQPFSIKSFQDASYAAGLILNEQLCSRFAAALITKPFVILTGLAGSGKTKLAQAFSQWISSNANQYRIIPVGADWTNREPLLGYPNSLNPKEYVKPENGVLDLVIRANNQPELPFFLILDEMNLSHVERYFADFLSIMESKEDIALYAEASIQNGVPAKLGLPANLFIIGTVNIDETTNMFSPKVLDRANTIEFRVTQEEMKNFLANIKVIDMDALIGKGAGMAKSFLDMSSNKSLVTKNTDAINEALIRFFSELKKTGAEFGYRSATEIMRLINQLTVIDSTLTTNQKIDIAIMQKLLPKLHGSRRKLCPVLETLGLFCISGEVKIIKDVFEKEDFDFNEARVLYPLSLEKITRMFNGAMANGFASFAEA